MGASIVTRVTAEGSLGMVVYDILDSSTMAFLEQTKEVGVYHLLLQDGEFLRAGDARGLKSVDAELAIGAMVYGYVTGYLPIHAADGDARNDLLVLRIRVKNFI